MKYPIGLALAATLISSAAAYAGDKTWTGQLVDTKCYLMNKTKNAGNDHAMGKGILKGCASACAKMGIPVALVADGKMYTLAVPAPRLAKYMAKKATITGTQHGDVIMPKKVMVDGKKVNISSMM